MPEEKKKLYLFRLGDRYKIGISKNVNGRLRDVQAYAHDVVHLICEFAAKDPRRLEAALHSRFNERNRYGEWFSLHPADVELIKRLDHDSAEEIMRTTRHIPRIGKKKDPACAVMPTITVKISRSLADEVSYLTATKRVDAAQHFGPKIQGWVNQLLRSALRLAQKDGFAESGDRRPNRKEKATPLPSTVRLWRNQVRALKIASAVMGCSTSSLVEKKLWEIINAEKATVA